MRCGGCLGSIGIEGERALWGDGILRTIANRPGRYSMIVEADSQSAAD